MASAIGHTMGAYTALILLEPKLIADPRSHRIALGTALVFGSLADADFVVAYFSTNVALRHHYFSHSIPFAVLLTMVCFLLLKAFRISNPFRTAWLLGAAFSTHLLLDFFTEDTSKPYGTPLFWPFTHHHFISPITLFYSTHRGSWEKLFSLHNAIGILIEVAILAPIVFLAFRRAQRHVAAGPRLEPTG